MNKPLLYIFVIFLSIPVMADTVILRNGKTYTNVKTRVSKGRIYIELESGARISFLAGQVKNLQPARVVWKERVIEKETTTSQNEVEREKKEVAIEEKDHANSSLLDDPYILALQGLIPGWSGLVLNDDYYLYGIVICALELGAVISLAPWMKTPPSQQQDQSLLLFALGMQAPAVPEGAPPPLIPPRLSPYILVSLQGNVVNPSGGYMTEDAFNAENTKRIGILSLLMVSDALLSWVYGSNVAAQSANMNTKTYDLHWSLDVMHDDDLVSQKAGFKVQFNF